MSKISVTTIAGLTSGGDANKVIIESGDTLQVDSNATVGGDLTVDTSTLKVNSSTNLVGIGTASPTSALHVSGGAGTNVAIQSSAGTHWRIGDGVGSTNGNLVIYDYTDSRKVFEIDTLGRLTIPNQPAFVVYGTQSSPASGSVLLFNTEKFDIGNNYNNTNGRFTAPVAGIYIFYCTQIGPNRNSVFRYRTRLNGTAYPSTDAQMRLNPGAAIHDYGTSAIMIQMAASDYVDVLFNSDDGNTGHGSSTSGHEIFSGYLIG